MFVHVDNCDILIKNNVGTHVLGNVMIVYIHETRNFPLSMQL